MSWVAIVPVKGNPGAKSRLGERPDRAGLADAFALDTVGALLSARGIDRVLVVTGDGELAVRLADLGADIVREDPVRASAAPTDPLNAAIRQGLLVARAAFPQANLAVLTGDLPALTPADVEHTLRLAAGKERSLVPDAAGAGTTTLLALAGIPIEPRFGVGSRAAHEAAGHVPLGLPASVSIRHDVDTAADLAVAQRLGLGPHTRLLVDGAPGAAASR
ncbi:2-phospho-L-lactate guanylyltransferase [Cryobacterium sp. TMT3-29-2]|uniref:2-phospho-L-lactate guanylyltransferase n=1 Tax=Cryobacterium sp. TMT3-29-2 TaxID=2555867 RepID=UPI001073181E|nr:2-phospho-L-lactate guanylyltransferase [Cryobacterium sp. TMT3-29-2]TFC90351.1 2-phospho-L-lactate guanylyltransferase [Cryobacterium sp. TMT3-29-2]